MRMKRASHNQRKTRRATCLSSNNSEDRNECLVYHGESSFLHRIPAYTWWAHPSKSYRTDIAQWVSELQDELTALPLMPPWTHSGTQIDGNSRLPCGPQTARFAWIFMLWMKDTFVQSIWTKLELLVKCFESDPKKKVMQFIKGGGTNIIPTESMWWSEHGHVSEEKKHGGGGSVRFWVSGSP